MVQGLGFWVLAFRGLGFRILGLGFRVNRQGRLILVTLNKNPNLDTLDL